MLLLLIRSIWDLGPLFTNSTFMMEDAIGTIISTIKNGKVNMDYKALEAWAIHRMVALRKVRSNLFQLEKGMFYLLMLLLFLYYWNVNDDIVHLHFGETSW